MSTFGKNRIPIVANVQYYTNANILLSSMSTYFLRSQKRNPYSGKFI